MAPKYKDGDVAFSFSGHWISWAHTIVAYTAFIGALITGLSLHYHKIVQNEYYVSDSQSSGPYEYMPDTISGISARMVSISIINNR